MSEFSFIANTEFIQIQAINHSDSKTYIGIYIYEVIPNTTTVQRYIAGLLFECNELNYYLYIPNLNEIQEKSYIITLITNDIVYIENDKLYLTNSTLLKLL